MPIALQGLVLALTGTAAVAHAKAPCTEKLTIAWRFHASAPIVASPATGKAGPVVVTSIDGYVHAMTDEGRFLWSYTLDTPASGFGLDEHGRVQVMSERGLMQVLQPSGSKLTSWRLPAPMLPTGPFAYDESSSIGFVPSAFNLYAYSATGVTWRAFLGSRIVSGPTVDPRGRAWVVTEKGELVGVLAPSRRLGFDLPSAADASQIPAPQLLSVSEQQVMILEREELTAYSLTGELQWRRGAVHASAADGGFVGIGGSWHWLDSRTGTTSAEHELDVSLSSPPVPMQEWMLLPTVQGRLYALSRQGDVQWCDVASAPLLQPRPKADTQGAIVAAGDGSVVEVRLREQSP